jgi:DNA-directed RNA polymerase beta' subunit
MRLNVDLPDWLYLKFKHKLGKTTMSSNIKNYILFSTGEGSQDLEEMKTNLELLNKRLADAEEQVGLIWIQYQEAVQTRDITKQDVASMEMIVAEKAKLLEDESMKQKEVEEDIKFNTMKQHLGDG